MRVFVFALAVNCVLAVGVLPGSAQEGRAKTAGEVAAGTFAWGHDLSYVRDHFVKAAEEFPEDKYGYRPTEDVRTFGEIVLHVARYNDLAAAGAMGRQPEDVREFAFHSKAEALSKLKESLRTQFNHDVGKVRLIVLVDPTCPPCRWGASEIEKQVLETIPGDRLTAYVVWLPVLNFQDEPTLQRNGQKESSRVADSRARHYIDPNGFAAKQYSPILNIPYRGPAWDVYLAYGPDVRWEDRPPLPTRWMHQGGDGMDRSRRLDGRKFANEIQQLLVSSASSKAAAH